MDDIWSTEGRVWVGTLADDQKQALRAFFSGTPDDALVRVQHRNFPGRLRKTTLEGYLTHVIDPTIKNGQDKAIYTLGGKPCRGMQAFRKQLVTEAMQFLK